MAERKFRINIDPTGLIPEKKGRGVYMGAIGIILVMGLLVGGALATNVLPQRVPLLLSLPWGEDRLVPNKYLLTLPLLGLVMLIINLMIGRIVANEEIERVALAVGTLVVALMLAISCIGILQSVL